MEQHTHLVMNGVKSSNFSVKDILELPEGKGTCSPIQADTTVVSSVASLTSIPHIPQVPELQNVSSYYDSSDNPYTRWLQTNEAIQYTRKYQSHNTQTDTHGAGLPIGDGVGW